MPYYQLQGDILFIACSPRRMQSNRQEVENCWQTLLSDIKTKSSAQLTDADVLLRSRQCCDRVQRWRRDCPLQTLNVVKRFCTDFQPIVQQALRDRKNREAAAPPPGGDGMTPQVPCTPSQEGKLLCQGPVPGLSCFPAAQGMFLCEVPVIPPSPPPTTPAPPSIPGPVYPDWMPDLGPGGPPKFPASAFPSESFPASPEGKPPSVSPTQSALAKWLPWILLGGAAIGIYYLIRRKR
jgi:hypothetical protein